MTDLAVLKQRLDDALTDVTQPGELDAVLRRGDRLRRNRRTTRLGTGLVAAAASAAIATAVLQPGSAGQPPLGTVTLVAFAAPTFPLTLTERPAGLGPAHYSQDPGDRQIAAFLGRDTNDAVYVVVTGDRTPDHGIPGEVSRQERRGDRWVRVTGIGRYASDAIVREVAADLVERPVRVPLRLRFAPAGWVVSAYKDDRILTLRDPRSGAELSVHLADRLQRDFVRATGATSSETVRVHGRKATLVEAQGLRMLQGQLPDGTPFVLQTPPELTRAQVLELGAAVELS